MIQISDEDKELMEASSDYKKACEVANKQAEYFLRRPDDYSDLWAEKSGYYRSRLIQVLRNIKVSQRD